MISPPDHHQAVALIDEARAGGARLKPACQELGIEVRTYQRWTRGGEIKTDARPGAVRPVPANTLSAEERAQVLAICHEPAYASLPPREKRAPVGGSGRVRGLRIDLLPHSSRSR